jgi:hypothetical protein
MKKKRKHYNKKFVDFASQLRCHRQQVGLQFLVHEENLVLISILLLLRCKDKILASSNAHTAWIIEYNVYIYQTFWQLESATIFGTTQQIADQGLITNSWMKSKKKTDKCGNSIHPQQTCLCIYYICIICIICQVTFHNW